MSRLNLTVDEVLSTTRTVRKRLDLTRPVEREVIEECIALAQQAPNGGNRQCMHFVVLSDPERRAALAAVFRRGHEASFDKGAIAAFGDRMGTSVDYLYDHLHEVPVLLVPCRPLGDRPRHELTPFNWATHYADGHMAAWSFMLAARERGLGTAMTTMHLIYEKEAAVVLEIDYERFAQTALIPVAYTIGTDFHPVARKPVAEILHWDRW